MATLPIEEINSATKIKIEPSKTHVTLKVRGADDDHDVYYRIQRDFPLHHLKLNYCNRLGFGYGAVRFVYRGAELRGTKTADDLQMKDGCAIDSLIPGLTSLGVDYLLYWITNFNQVSGE